MFERKCVIYSYVFYHKVDFNCYESHLRSNFFQTIHTNPRDITFMYNTHKYANKDCIITVIIHNISKL